MTQIWQTLRSDGPPPDFDESKSPSPPAAPQERGSQETSHHKVAVGAGIMAFFTGISRVTGLARDLVMSHIFGAGSGVMDAYVVANTIPNMLRVIVGEGAMSVSFVPIYSRLKAQEGEEKAREFFRAALGLLLCILVVITAIGIASARYFVLALASGFAEKPGQLELATSLTQWMFPYIFLVSLVALAMGVQNCHNVFAAPAASPILLNLAICFCSIFLGSYFDEPIFASALGVIVGGILQIALQLPSLKRLGMLVWPTLDFGNPHVRRLLRIMVPTLVGVAVYQLNLVILRQIGSYLPAGQLTYYFFADRFMQLALGVFATSIATASLPEMAKLGALEDKQNLLKMWSYSTRLSNFITIPAMFGLMAIAVPVLSVLFLHGKYDWHDVQMTAYTTMAFACGLISMAMTRTTVQAFYALHDTRTPVMAGFISMIATLVFGLSLLRFEVVGLGISLALASWVQTILLLWWLQKKVGRLEGGGLLKATTKQIGISLVASFAAYAVCLLGHWQEGPTVVNASVLLASVLVAAIVYFALAWVFKIEEAKPVIDLAVRKIRNKFGRV